MVIWIDENIYSSSKLATAKYLGKLGVGKIQFGVGSEGKVGLLISLTRIGRI